MKIWISKYALSSGITVHEVVQEKVSDGYVYPGPPFAGYVGFKIGKDAHTTYEDAVKAAEVARLKRIASVRKLLAKLEKMSFDA